MYYKHLRYHGFEKGSSNMSCDVPSGTSEHGYARAMAISILHICNFCTYNRCNMVHKPEGHLHEDLQKHIGGVITDKTPIRRFGEPSDLVGAAIFLAGPASRFVTGIPRDGVI